MSWRHDRGFRESRRCNRLRDNHGEYRGHLTVFPPTEPHFARGSPTGAAQAWQNGPQSTRTDRENTQ
jgi:hypothetical protein